MAQAKGAHTFYELTEAGVAILSQNIYAVRWVGSMVFGKFAASIVMRRHVRSDT